MQAALWKRAVTKHVVPELPGRWHVDGTKLVVLPVEHIACAVVRANTKAGTYYLYASLRPMFTGGDEWTSAITHRLGGGALLPASEDSMGAVTELIRSDALPFFASYGDLAGFVNLCARTARDHPGAGRVHALHEQAAAQLLLGDVTGAHDTLTRIRHTADAMADAPKWLLDRAAEADRLRHEAAETATRSLLAVEAETRARFKLGASR